MADLVARYLAPPRYRRATVRTPAPPGWQDLNVRELAKTLRLPLNQVRLILTGRADPKWSMLKLIANELELSLPMLVERIETAYRLDELKRQQTLKHSQPIAQVISQPPTETAIK